MGNVVVECDDDVVQSFPPFACLFAAECFDHFAGCQAVVDEAKGSVKGLARLAGAEKIKSCSRRRGDGTASDIHESVIGDGSSKNDGFSTVIGVSSREPGPPWARLPRGVNPEGAPGD